MGNMLLTVEVSGCEFGFEAEKIDPLAKQNVATSWALDFPILT